MIHGCLLRTQKCFVGRGHEVSSKVDPHSEQPITGFAGAKEPATTFRADPSNFHPPAVGDGFERSRFTSHKTKARNGESYGKSATRQMLAVGAMARVHQTRGFGDPVADLAA